jgi:hypothetical protein
MGISADRLRRAVSYAGLAVFAFLAQLLISSRGFFVGEGDLRFLFSVAVQISEGTLRSPNLYIAAFPTTVTYPAVIAVLMRFFNTTSPWVFVLVNHFVMCAVVSAAYGFLKNRMSWKFAFTGALLIALHPFTHIYANTSNAELVFGGLVLLSFFAFAKANDANKSNPSLVWVGLSALLASFAGWARPLAVLMVLAYIGYALLFSKYTRLYKGLVIGIFLAVYILCGQASALVVRHYTGHTPASSAYSFGWNLYVGASSAGTWNEGDAERFNAALREADSPNEIHRYFARQAVERYRDMGAGFVPHTLRKLRVWNAHAYISAFCEGPAQATVRPITAVYDIAVFLLAAAGGVCILIKSVKDFRKHRAPDVSTVLTLYLAGSVAALMLLEIAPRYVVSYRMVFCLFAIIFLQQCRKYVTLRIGNKI